jgi:hypothetical protein
MSRKLSASEISAMLADQMRSLAKELLRGGQEHGNEWKAGSVAGEPGNSLSVCLSGAKRGRWKDFAADVGGDPLDLIAACLTGGNLKDAFKWACNWLGMSDETVEIRRAEIQQKAEACKAEAEQQAQRRVMRARDFWMAAQSDISGTPVAAYLHGRGIDLRQLGYTPGALRFAPAHYCKEIDAPLPAMLAAITNLEGRCVAVHQTWLGQHGGQWTKAKLELPKKVLGGFRGSCIRLRKGASGTALKQVSPDETVAIGEGIETCLSVALACPDLRILAAISLANLGTIRLPDAARNVLILADRDSSPQAQQGLEKAVAQHIQAGRSVSVAMPPKGQKDFNDALK